MLGILSEWIYDRCSSIHFTHYGVEDVVLFLMLIQKSIQWNSFRISSVSFEGRARQRLSSSVPESHQEIFTLESSQVLFVVYSSHYELFS